MPKVEQVGENDWEFVYPPKYKQLMDKFDEGIDLWKDPEMKEWLTRNAGRGKRSK